MYRDFAAIYDILMQDAPYQRWLKRVDGWIEAYGVSAKKTEDDDEKNLVVELACGTGTFTEMLANLGYEMIGIDNAPAMLSVAAEKKSRNQSQTLYLRQDIRELELYSTVGTIVCVCDSLNYLLSEEDLLATFRLVQNYLYPNGLFIFDFNTVYEYETVCGETTIAENHDLCSFIWENYYHSKENMNECDLTFFIKESDGRFRRCQETHRQRGYELEQMKRLLRAAGLEFVLAVDDNTDGASDEESERVFVLARKG
jgi:SAM-dependent methyltransferase